MNRSHRRIPVLLALLLAASGCATVQMAAKESDTAAKAFATRPDAANLYVYRASSFGLAVKYPVIVDGKMLGELPGSTFLLVPVAPGQHMVLVTAESNKTVQFTAEAGQNVYVKVTPAMGFFSAGVSLTLMTDENEARQDVSGCSLIQVMQ